MGRNGRSVKPSAKPTLVRTQHLPRPAQIARELGFPGLAGCSFGRREVPLRPWESGCFLAEIGTAAAGAAKTDAFLGERYRHIGRRRGSKCAIVAIGRSIPVIVWHLLADRHPSTISGQGSTPPASTPNAASEPTSASSKPTATPSTSSPPPEPPPRRTRLHQHSTARCRAPRNSPIFGLAAARGETPYSRLGAATH
jgi:hypothetical protein